MPETITVVGTGGVIEGNLGTSNVNVNLDAVLDFDANSTEEHILVADHADFDVGTGAFSTSWWMKTTNTDEFYVVSKMVSAWPGFRYGCHSDGHLQIQVQDSSGVGDDHNGSKDLDDGSWHHICVTLAGPSGAWKGYVDGVLEISETAPAYGSLDNANGLSIGAAYTGQAQPFDGQLADVRFWKGEAVSADDVKVLASKINVDPSLTSTGTTNLKGWWKLNEGTGTTATDSSGNSKNGTLTNFSGSDYWQFDAFSVNVQDNSTTTDGTFTVTQGKLEGKALSSLEFNGSDDSLALNGNLSMAGDFTFSTWFNADEFDNNVLLAKGSDSSCVIRISNSGAITFNFNNQGEEAISGITFAGTGAWTHLVITRDYSTGKTDVYVNGVYQSTATFDSGNATGNFDVIGKGSSYYWDGHLRDMRMYDAIILSADQIASLYSGTYPVMPKYWWKMDEGTGLPLSTGTESISNPSDTGANGATVDAVWDNGTLNLDGTLTIAANGTLSAPRGNLAMGAAFHSNATAPTTQFIHNNGTFTFDGGNSTLHGSTTSTGTHFYNLTGGDNGYVDSYEYYTVENKLTTSGSRTWYLNDSGKIFIGTSTVAGEMEINGALSLGTNGQTYIEGVGGPTLPALIDYNGSHSGASGDTGGADAFLNLTNVNWDGALTTGTTNIKLGGDAEFDNITVSSGAKLDVNGQRLECADWTQTGGGSPSVLDIDDSLCIVSGHVDWNGIIPTANTGTKLIHSTSAEKNWRSNYTGDGTWMCTGSQTTMTGYQWASGSDQLDNVIIGSGTLDSNSLNNTTDNLTIATGGTYTAGGTTITLAGDFTTSGGLLGASCLSLDRDNTEYARSVNHADLDLFNSRDAMTAECWFKTSYTGSNHQHIFNLKDNDGSPQVMEMYIDYSTGKINGRIYTSGTTNTIIGAADVRDGKWHHVAIVYDGDTDKHSLYVDGKLEAEETGSGAIYAATDAEFNIGVRYSLDQGYFHGEIDEVRLFAAAKTAAQIRADMFVAEGTNLTHFNSQADGSTDGLVGRWGCNDGSGSTLTCSNTNLNMTIKDHAAGPAAYSDAWAGAGTFTYGTSTLVMAKSGTQTLNYRHVEEIYNLTINDGSTTQIQSIGDANGLLDINNNLTVNEKLKSHADSAQARIRIASAAKTITIGSDVKTTALSELYSMEIEHSGSTNVPELTTPRLLLDNTATAVATGNLTITEELECKTGTTFNANGNTINVKLLDSNTGTVNLSNSALSFLSAGQLNLNYNSTLTTGNTTITGYSSGSKTTAVLPMDGNFEVVGDVKWMKMNTDSDLTVIGAVIDCDTSLSGANIRQWHHTLDTQQLLDADEAGDDDLRLEKPNLDNAHELQTG